MITKNDFIIWTQLNDNIEDRADFILDWYHKNICEFHSYKDLQYNRIKDDQIIYRSRFDVWSGAFIPLKLLFMSDSELERYKDKNDKEISAEIDKLIDKYPMEEI